MQVLGEGEVNLQTRMGCTPSKRKVYVEQDRAVVHVQVSAATPCNQSNSIVSRRVVAATSPRRSVCRQRSIVRLAVAVVNGRCVLSGRGPAVGE